MQNPPKVVEMPWLKGLCHEKSIFLKIKNVKSNQYVLYERWGVTDVILQAFNKNITSRDPLPFEGVTYGAFLAKDTFSAKIV